MRRRRDHRDFFVAVEGWRRGDRPFQRRRALAPVIRADPPPEGKGVEYDEDEEQRRGIGDEGADRRDEVPAPEGVGVFGDASRHAGQPKEMLWEEGQVDADEGGPEMDLAEGLIVLVPRHLADPVIEPGKQPEYRAQ